MLVIDDATRVERAGVARVRPDVHRVSVAGGYDAPPRRGSVGGREFLPRRHRAAGRVERPRRGGAVHGRGHDEERASGGGVRWDRREREDGAGVRIAFGCVTRVGLVGVGVSSAEAWTRLPRSGTPVADGDVGRRARRARAAGGLTCEPEGTRRVADVVAREDAAMRDIPPGEGRCRVRTARLRPVPGDGWFCLGVLGPNRRNPARRKT